MKILKGSVVIDPSMIKLLEDRELDRLLSLLIKISREGLYRVFIATSPFNANIALRGSRVYRASIGYGAFIVQAALQGTVREDLGNVVGDLCGWEGRAGELCWYLGEDMWVDARILIPRVSLDPLYRCPREYEESIVRLGLELVAKDRARILCLGDGDRLTIADPGVNYLAIPVDVDMDRGYRDHPVDRAGGYKHPIAVLLSGRRVACSDPKDLELPEGSEAVVRTAAGDTLLHTIYDQVYVFGCKPMPGDLLFNVAAIYVSTHHVSSHRDLHSIWLNPHNQ